MTHRWLPTTTASKLALADTILAGIVPTITDTRARILDLVPGHSGRPAGNGDPPGGQGGATTSVVERTLGIIGEDLKTRGVTLRISAEQADLDTLDHCVNHIDHLTRTIVGYDGWGALPPFGVSQARRLAWDRWAIRTIAPTNPTIPNWLTRDLCDTAHRLESLIAQWAPAEQTGRRTTELAADDTGLYCQSCLRAGYRNPRWPRYTGLCRWCGNFKAEQGALPTLDIIDAHESGSPLAVARLIRDDTKPRRRKRKR